MLIFKIPMFSQEQQQKIKIFSSIVKINDICFNKCIEIPSQDLVKNEKDCLGNCVNEYFDLRNNLYSQMMNDKKSVNDKNNEVFNRC